jgi:protein-tyrosine phosphatase
LTIKTVLFLCTGNYYRSRFAEELFNHRAAQTQIGWQAQSRALAVERGANNVGPLSPFVLQGLKARGLSAQGGGRMPLQCVAIDLENAHRIVALHEPEHRPLLRAVSRVGRARPILAGRGRRVRGATDRAGGDRRTGRCAVERADWRRLWSLAGVKARRGRASLYAGKRILLR